MYKLAVRASREEVLQAFVGVVATQGELQGVLESYAVEFANVRAELASLLARSQSDVPDADRNAMTGQVEGVDETVEAVLQNFLNELNTTLQRVRSSWERLTDSFLSHYSEATLDTDEERKHALSMRAALLELREKFDLLISDTRSKIVLSGDSGHAAPVIGWAEQITPTQQMLAEEYSLILSSLIRMINILDVRLEDSSEPASALHS